MALAEQNDLQHPQRRSLISALAGKIRHRRNRIIANPAFQNWVARLPIIRRVGNHKARKLFDLTAGFVYSQILYSLVESDIIVFLQNGARSTADIAKFAGLVTDRAECLLRAAAEIDLLREIDEQWYLTDLSAVVSANAGIRAMIRHHKMLYDDLSDPLKLLHGGDFGTKTNDFWRYAGSEAPKGTGPEEAAAYSALMSASQDLVIEEILAAYNFSRHRCVLDIGGGEGRFIKAVAERSPHLYLRLFDLPAVARQAQAAMKREELRDRLEVFSGDFFQDALPTGSDLVTLVRVLCDHDDGPALKLLANIHEALAPRAKVLIAEPMGGRDGGAGGAAAYFSLYFLAMQSGRLRRPEDIRRLLDQAGFSDIRHIKTRQPLIASLMIAHR